mmetsp:Transcript_34787/g.58016  ORF Transcript_34787/g.58016 Transcript_34787/m.58016 type:complete len:215 (+) Transcript_34787:1313-1957(+)
MPFENLQKLSAGGVPDADGLVLRARDHQLQIRTQAHGAHGGLMPLQTVQRLPRHHVPEAHRLIQRSRYDGVRVGGQRCAEYSPVVPLKCTHQFPLARPLDFTGCVPGLDPRERGAHSVAPTAPGEALEDLPVPLWALQPRGGGGNQPRPDTKAGGRVLEHRREAGVRHSPEQTAAVHVGGHVCDREQRRVDQHVRQSPGTRHGAALRDNIVKVL